MKKIKICKNKKILACILSGSLFFPSVSLASSGDAYYEGDKFVIEEYGVGKIEINKDEIEVLDDNVYLIIGDLPVVISKDDYNDYLELADSHEREMNNYLSIFGILGFSLGTIVISNSLKNKIYKKLLN